MGKAVAWIALILVVGLSTQQCDKPGEPEPLSPELSVSPDSLQFGPLDNQKTLTVKNAGEGTLKWEVASGEEWLTAKPKSGSLQQGASEPAQVTVDRAKVSANGIYRSDVTFTSTEGGSKTVSVTMVVEGKEVPVLSVSPSALAFGLESSSEELRVSNTGYGVLQWRAFGSHSWLTVSPDSGGVPKDGSQLVTVTVTRAGMGPGNEYAGAVEIRSAVAGTRSVPVTMSVPNPVIRVSIRDLNFGAEHTELSLTISNVGTGTVNWSLSIPDEMSWLSAVPEEGSATLVSSSSVRLSVTREGLAPGRYTGKVLLTSNSTVESRIELMIAMEVIARPELLVTPSDSLAFGMDLTSADLKITNANTGILEWKAEGTEAWISVTPSTGTCTALEEDRVTVRVTREGLPPGPHMGSVQVNSNGGSRILRVTMMVQENPILSVTPNALDLGETRGADTLHVRNTGTGTLTWQISDDAEWLSSSPFEGQVTVETDVVVVTLDRSDLAPGEYNGTVTVTSNGGIRAIAVGMRVRAEPVLSVSLSELNLGMEVTRMAFAIRNVGTGILTWELSENISWLTAAPANGAVSADAEDSVVVRVDRSGLEPAPGYSGVISLTSVANREDLVVKMGVKEAPVLGVDPERLTFGASTDTLYLYITNQGTGKVTWRISENAEWLWLQAIGGMSEKERDEIAVMVDRTGQVPGKHTTVLTISAAEAGEQVVTIDMDVAQLAVSSDMLDFGTEDDRQEIMLSRLGSGDIGWTASANAGWIGVAPSEGIIGDESVDIGITVHRGAVVPGTYTGAVRIRGDNDDELSVGVTATVLEEPELWVSTTELDFGIDQDRMTFVVGNVGTGVLDWSLSEELAWVDVSRISGAAARGTKDTVWVDVDRSVSEIGRYTGILQIASDGGDRSVSISMEIPAEPVLSVSPTQLDLGTEGTEGRFTVRNSGTGTLSWTLFIDQSWLSAVPKQGAIDRGGSQEIVVRAERVGLVPGAYTGGISITSNGGAERTEVTLTVLERTQEGETTTMFLPGGAEIEMVWIEPGTFMMGSPEDEPGRDSDEGPVHEVTITRGFYLGKYELTQEQWESVMGTRPWEGRDYVKVNADHPSVYISWDDMQALTATLNEVEGVEVYRLPTEAEWEYACRAGTTTPWSFEGNESQLVEYAWYRDNAWDIGERYAHEVGTKLPNPWGLYDMHGNVWEWCQDWYGPYLSSAQVNPTGPSTGSNRVLRSGLFEDYARGVRSASRNSESPGGRLYFGARLLREEDPYAPSGGNGSSSSGPEGMVLIPAGTFQMGDAIGDGESRERPVHDVYLDAFYIDKYEVTNAQYCEFLNAAGNQSEGGAAWLDIVESYCPITENGGEFVPKIGYQNHPVLAVTWQGAKAYCEWFGKRLPTEAEWERAARGGLEGKRYSWGDAEPDGSQCNFADRSSPYVWGDKNADDGYSETAPVGSYPPNGYGLYDMIGNVCEWCSDWCFRTYTTDSVINPVGPNRGTQRMIRGDTYHGAPPTLRVSFRYGHGPEDSRGDAGFRCVRTP